MGLKKVYVIFDSNIYTKHEISEDFRAEGYKCEFFFGSISHLSPSAKKRMILESDEVWVYGQCSKYADYKIAEDVGADIWNMR